ncbi:MAG: DNA internalization-related competence protein ComEC/Rec2, partial [Clostridia bacterium]|nr:DNA internalization-related competence protein ComEC/Rec2 [Clostridia bacterium]
CAVPASAAVILCALFLTALILAAAKKRRCSCLIMAFALCLGILRMELAVPVVPASETRYSVNMSGTVLSDPYIKSDTGRLIFLFRTDTVDGVSEDSTIRLYLRGEPDALNAIEYGQTLSVTGHIWAPDAISNPDQFDFGAYLSENGMSAYGTAKIEDISILSCKRDFNSVVIGIRSALSGRIDRLFPDNAAIVKALVLADRSEIEDDIRDSFSKTGVTHLICISGMHVSVLAMAMLFVLRRMMPRSYAISITFLMLAAYGVLIGFTASFVRALIMFIIFSCAPAAGYPSDGITRLMCAMLLTLMVEPRQISDAGFVLSYSATAGIILLCPPLNELLGITEQLHDKPPKRRLFRLLRRIYLYFPRLLCATLAAQLAALPAVIANFGVQSIVSVPVNLVCVPLCMLAYPLAIIVMAVSAVCLPVAEAMAAIPEAMFSMFSMTALHTAALPVTGIRIGKYSALLVLTHWAVILSASNLSRIRMSVRRFIPSALIPIALLASLIVYLSGLGHTIVFLDAEQADCAVIRTEGRTYLVDAGDTYTPSADYLNANCLSLDGIFLSHPDEDHSGGLTKVLETMKPDALYIPSGWHDIDNISSSVREGIALAERMGVEIIELSAGDTLSLSRNTTARVYGPDSRTASGDSNAISMVLYVEHKGRTALFTGDLPVQNEPAFIPRTDILKVAHHGSSESTSQSFIDAASPDYAIISVGQNSFGHPSDEVVERLADAGAAVLRTDRHGAISMKLDRNNQWQVKTYLPLEEQHELE